jgi:hypothetical protein
MFQSDKRRCPMVDKKALCDKIRKLYPDIERLKEA